jgi:hypothetical protein
LGNEGSLWSRAGELVLAPPDVDNPNHESEKVVTIDIDDERQLILKMGRIRRYPYWQEHDLTPRLHRPPWLTAADRQWWPLNQRDQNHAYHVAHSFVEQVIVKMRAKPELYEPLRRWLITAWQPLVLGTRDAIRRDGIPLLMTDRVMLATMAVFKVGRLISYDDDQGRPPKLVSLNENQPIISDLINQAPRIRRLIRAYLEHLGFQVSKWMEAAVFGLLLHPQGIAWIRIPFNLGPRGEGTEVERGMEFAVGIPSETYRVGGKYHAGFLRAHGVVFQGATRGAKPGKPRIRNKSRQRFVDYILERVARGLSPQVIANDAEAQRLYRASRRDTATASLDEAKVRYVIRAAKK